MQYKFEKLKVWGLSLSVLDQIYDLSTLLPESEKFNLSSQIIRAGTSISLNIAEGSTSRSNKEQKRFLGYAIRWLTEVVACLRIIERRGYKSYGQKTSKLEKELDTLFVKLQAFRKVLN